MEIKSKLNKKVKDVMSLGGDMLLVFFRDGKSVMVNAGEICGDDLLFGNVIGNSEIFNNVKVSPGGNGIEWGEERFIPAESYEQAVMTLQSGMKTLSVL